MASCGNRRWAFEFKTAQVLQCSIFSSASTVWNPHTLMVIGGHSAEAMSISSSGDHLDRTAMCGVGAASAHGQMIPWKVNETVALWDSRWDAQLQVSDVCKICNSYWPSLKKSISHVFLLPFEACDWNQFLNFQIANAFYGISVMWARREPKRKPERIQKSISGISFGIMWYLVVGQTLIIRVWLLIFHS